METLTCPEQYVDRSTTVTNLFASGVSCVEPESRTGITYSFGNLFVGQEPHQSLKRENYG